MDITVEWTRLTSMRHPLWDDTMCLYAYAHLVESELLYLGKADYSSPRTRLSGDH